MTTPDSKSADAQDNSISAFLYCVNPEDRRALEEFRIKYENEFGPTDLTKRYTSVWPMAQQQWMADHEPKRYWDGLPPFVKAFIKGRMEAAHKAGTLENIPNTQLLTLYLQKQMTVGEDGYDR